MLPRVPHPTMWSLVDNLRPYAVFQYGADRMASAICSVTSVKKSEVTSCNMVVVYDVIVTSWSAYGGWSVYYNWSIIRSHFVIISLGKPIVIFGARPNVGHLTQNRKPLGSERAQNISLKVKLFLLPCWLLRCPRRHVAIAPTSLWSGRPSWT